MTNSEEISKKQICLLIHSLAPGGMERAMSELAKHFAARPEVELHMILYGRKREVFFTIPSNVTIHKPRFSFDNRRRFICTVRTLFFIRKKVKGISPITILSFGEYWNNLVLLSLTGLKFPVYISDRSSPGKNLGWFHNSLRNLLYRRAAGYIAQTRYAGELALKKRWNRNVTVIGNPIRQIASSNEVVQEKIVLSAGRLISTKNFDKLIELFVDIDNPEWKLVIVGGDALKQNNLAVLKELVRTLHVEDRVFLEGNQLKIDSYYLKSRIFAFMSSSEGFPNVIGETLSAGVPVIAYDCVAGPSDLIRDGENGFLIPLFDFKLFRQKLISLMQDDDLRNKLASRATKSVEMYKSDVIAESFYHFICQP